jgi:hypothetical protein
MYKELIDTNKTWNLMSYEEQSLMLKSKRSNNELDTSKLVKLYPHVSDIKTAVYNTLKKRANNVS